MEGALQEAREMEVSLERMALMVVPLQEPCEGTKDVGLTTGNGSTGKSGKNMFQQILTPLTSSYKL